MGDTGDAKDAINARKEIFFKYLKTIENREILFEKIFTSFLQTYKDESYIYDLKDSEIKSNFKNSIINGHFEWMSQRITNQNQTKWKTEYSIKAKEVIKTLTKLPYHHFYKELKNTTSKELELRQRGKEIVQDRCTELIEKYRP